MKINNLLEGAYGSGKMSYNSLDGKEIHTQDTSTTYHFPEGASHYMGDPAEWKADALANGYTLVSGESFGMPITKAVDADGQVKGMYIHVRSYDHGYLFLNSGI
jgi:hypothetical protein